MSAPMLLLLLLEAVAALQQWVLLAGTT